MARSDRADDDHADDQDPNTDGHDRAEGSGSTTPPLEVHLKRALKGAKSLQDELVTLKKRNGVLQRRLEELEQAEGADMQPRRGLRARPTITGLQGQVQNLKDKIKKLEKESKRDKRKIEKLKEKEVEADADDLQEAVFEVGDTAHHMRKLLRRFHDLMLSPSLEEGEECPVCMEPFQSRKCKSLPCDHTLCDGCVKELSSNKEDVACPQCRRVWPLDELETVQYTASQQWDALLDVAKDWAKIDRRGEDDTSEEEAQEEFIDNGQPDATSSEASAPQDPLATSPEPEPEAQPEESEPEAPAIPVKKRRAVAFESSPEPDVVPSAEAEAPQVEQAGTNSNGAAPPNKAGQSNDARPSTPPNSTAQSYAQTPKSEKRKRMEELAARRNSKRSRH